MSMFRVVMHVVSILYKRIKRISLQVCSIFCVHFGHPSYSQCLLLWGEEKVWLSTTQINGFPGSTSLCNNSPYRLYTVLSKCCKLDLLKYSRINAGKICHLNKMGEGCILREHMLHRFENEIWKWDLTANCKEYARAAIHMLWVFPLIKSLQIPVISLLSKLFKSHLKPVQLLYVW